jgi:Ca-activated chloride channel family protein
LLRNSEHKGVATWQQAADLARRHRGDDPDGYRAEFVRVVELADSRSAQKTTARFTGFATTAASALAVGSRS